MAGYLVEVLSGKPYADAMAERVFGVCGMNHTTLRPMMAMTYPLAQGHDVPATGEPTIARPAADNASGWPAGSVFSSAPDLARFVIAFLNDGMLDGKRALDPRIFAAMSSPHAEVPGGGSYGYGLTLAEFRGVHMVEHNGSRMGYGSSIRMAPEQRVAVIVLANRSGASLPATTEKALELMLPLKPKTAAGRRVLEASAEDQRNYSGVYRNGDTRIEITVRDGRLWVRRGASESPLTKVGDARFTQEGGGSFVFVEGGYVHNGGRSFAR
jgi:CubicO group peptidase (beta-lactamase class C family)